MTVVDPSIEEEQCAPVSVVVGVAPNSTISAVQVIGPGTIGPHTLQRVLKVSILPSMITCYTTFSKPFT